MYLSRTGSNIKTKKYLADQATKAMFLLLRKIKKLTLPFDIQIDLFEKCVKPILLYGCEIWGFGNIDVLERVQLKFYKYIFNLKKSTPNYMVYGEIGIQPLSVDIKTRIVSYWARMIDNKENSQVMKLNSKLYVILSELVSQRRVKSPWFENVKGILCNNGYSGIWYSQSFSNSKWLIKYMHQKLNDCFIQQWHSDIDRTSASNFYKIVKVNFAQSNYINDLSSNLTKSLLSFITKNHRLPIETGRWNNTVINERKCVNCDDVGDEFHYLFKCNTFTNERHKYLNRYYYNRPNTQKLRELFDNVNKEQIRKQ